MSERNLPFFRGVAIAAQHAFPEVSPALLASDARHFASVAAPAHESIELSEAQAAVAAAWLDTRRKKPHVELDPSTVTGALASAHRLGGASQKAGRVAFSAREHIADPSLASLFGGTQAGIALLHPTVDAERFHSDLDDIQKIVPTFAEIARREGISESAVAELYAHEYAFVRLADATGPLPFLGAHAFGTGARFGWIDVTTDPPLADVCVDGKPVGTSPVSQLLAAAGNHTVKSSKGVLNAQKSAKVVAVRKIVVDLQLT